MTTPEEAFRNLKTGKFYRLINRPYVLNDEPFRPRNDAHAVHWYRPGILFFPTKLTLPCSSSLFALARVQALIEGQVMSIMITPGCYEAVETDLTPMPLSQEQIS